MMRSMYAGVSGLKVHQTKMDVIGNNIANVNTTGYKGSRATFKDMLSQMMQGAKATQNNRGGINPQQVGLGVSLGSIDTNLTQGNLQSTGVGTDLAIQGNGYFIVNDGQQDLYTRAGALSFDDSGNFVSASNGYIMQGWMADAQGNINTNDSMTGIRIPIGETMPGKMSTETSFGGNLDGRVGDGATRSATIDVFDSLGEKHTMMIEFTRPSGDANNWDWKVSSVMGASNINGNGTIAFNDDGTFDKQNIGTPITFKPDGAATAADPIGIDFSNLTQSAAAYSVDGLKRNGYEMGSLQSFSVDNGGTITGNFSNGLTRALGCIGVANFSNPSGLERRGDTLFGITQNSGDPQKGIADNGGRGKIASGTLEMSNVDLAEQFTEMITAQRGFQANSKIITTSDQMLQDLVNLKR